MAYETWLDGATWGIAVRDTCTGAAPVEACVPYSRVISFDPTGSLLHSAFGARISRDGRYVAYAGTRIDAPPVEIFLRDRDTDGDGIFDEEGEGTTLLVTPDPGGGALAEVRESFDLDASGRYVAFESGDPDLTGNATSFNTRSYLRDTCVGAPLPGCVPVYRLLSVRADGTPPDDGFNLSTQLTDLSASARFAAYLTTDALMVGNNPNAFGGLPMSVLRDTCLGAPPGCVPGNRVISRLTDGSLFSSTKSPLLSDDGTRAIFFGRRTALLGAPDPDTFEVLAAKTDVPVVAAVVPKLEARTPGSVPAGSPGLLLTITGDDFQPGVQVRWISSNPPENKLRDAIFVSRRKLQLRVPEADLASPGVVQLRIVNPGNTVSGTFTFTKN